MAIRTGKGSASAGRGAVPADRPFGNPIHEPAEEALEAVLGAAIGHFDIVRGLARDFTQEWSFFRGSGWMLRIHDGRKSLLYLIPLRGAFRVSMAIRESERDAFANDPGLAPLHAALTAAKKVPEGFAVVFDADGLGDFDPLRSLIEKLIEARRA
jgi:Protein of unknown function (DUF3788)